MSIKFVLVASILLQVVSVSFAWGENGHKIIAQIASDLLNSEASSIVQQFIGSETLADIAPLPDDYDHSAAGKWSAPCHYVNMPQDATNFSMAYCTGCCVVKAIMNYTQILGTEETNPNPCDFDTGIEPCALEFLVHFVGDSHQPLHVGYASDAGGNTVSVNWYGESTNLHHVWDDSIILTWDSDWQDAVDQLESMMQNEPGTVKYYASITDPVTWADESFHYVQTTCYNFTGSSDDVLNSYNTHKLRQTDPNLGDVYYNRNLPIVQQRLIAAGVRLGNLLNRLLTGSSLF